MLALFLGAIFPVVIGDETWSTFSTFFCVTFNSSERGETMSRCGEGGNYPAIFSNGFGRKE